MEEKLGKVPPERDPVAFLLEKVPEYRSHMDTGVLDLPYMMYGFFALYLLESVKDDDIICRVFELLNELCDSGNTELQNLAYVGVFEVIAGDRYWSALADQHLHGEGSKLFRQAQSGKQK